MSENLLAKWYQENKERLHKAHERYQRLAQKEKEIKGQYGREHCKKSFRKSKTKACWVCKKVL